MGGPARRRQRKSFPRVGGGGSLGEWLLSTGPSFVMFGSRKNAGGFYAEPGSVGRS